MAVSVVYSVCRRLITKPAKARNIVPNLGLDIQALRQKHKIGISKYLKFFKIHKNKEFPVNFFCRDKDKVNKN